MDSIVASCPILVARNAHLSHDTFLTAQLPRNWQPVPYFARNIKLSTQQGNVLIPFSILRVFLVRSFVLRRFPLLHVAGRTTLGIVGISSSHCMIRAHARRHCDKTNEHPNKRFHEFQSFAINTLPVRKVNGLILSKTHEFTP
jgi:hypothetical protein